MFEGHVSLVLYSQQQLLHFSLHLQQQQPTAASKTKHTCKLARIHKGCSKLAPLTQHHNRTTLDICTVSYSRPLHSSKPSHGIPPKSTCALNSKRVGWAVTVNHYSQSKPALRVMKSYITLGTVTANATMVTVLLPAISVTSC